MGDITFKRNRMFLKKNIDDLEQALTILKRQRDVYGLRKELYCEEFSDNETLISTILIVLIRLDEEKAFYDRYDI